MQEGRTDSWEERIRWIVDTHESGDTESERMGKMAEKLGVSREAVRLMCKGKSIPRGETLEVIVAKYPRVNPAWLLTGTGPRTRTRTNGRDPYAEGARLVVDKVVKALLQAQLEATGRESTEGADGLARLVEDMEEIPGAGPPPEADEHPPEEDQGHEEYGT